LPRNTISQYHIALIAVCAGYLLAPMGLAAVNVAIPPMALELGASAVKVAWLPTLYILSNVAFLLPVGKLADMYGRKRMFVSGLILNTLAALVCTFTSNIDVILFWRFVQGISAAMIFSTGIAIVSSIVPDHKRGVALGIVASCVYFGLTLAPLLGGYLTDIYSWRAVFFFQVPPMLLLILGIYFFLQGEWKHPFKGQFDWLGAGIVMCLSVLLVYGLSYLNTPSGQISAVGALILVGVFIRQQAQHPHPLLRMQLFADNRLFSFSLITSFFMYGSNFALLFLLSLYLQIILGYSPTQAGFILMLQALTMALIAPLAGKLADRFASRNVATIGCVGVAVGLVVLNQLDSHSQASDVGLGLLIIGVGFGLFSTPNNNAIMGAVSKDDVGVASAAMNLARTVGNLVGMSLVNVIVVLYIGDAVIDQLVRAELMQTVNAALKLSLAMVLLACVSSFQRGKQ
jgi:EmrB/QacA subfamily drug resistance transporter